jgi:DegV family protein with EDD domain
MTSDNIGPVSSSIGLVTDSSSQITADLIAEFDVEVVPLTVTIDGVDHLEGLAEGQLDADGFYDHFVDGATPEIATSQPAPGRFAAAYERLVARGCDEIVSIHIAAAMSGTIGSATLAADAVDVPVHVIDTGSASFGVAVCTWAAGVAIARGANADDIRRRVDGLVPRIGTAFMVGVPLLIERGGRAAGIGLDGADIPVLAMSGGELRVLDRVSTLDDTVDVMSTYAASWGSGVTVAVGTADEPSRALSERLTDALADAPGVDAVVPYRIGPSVGAHTGPGTFGLFVFPTIR